MDKKVQAALLFILAVFLFLAGSKYGNLLLEKETPPVEKEIQVSAETAKGAEFSAFDKGTNKQTGEIFVHVTGAVKKPGLLKLKDGARIYDAVQIAEPTAKADLDALNLAEKLSDQEKIIVPEKGAVKPLTNGSGEALTIKPNSTQSAGGQEAQSSNGLVNINTASASELDKLPGIGPAYAQRIVDYRTQNGPFSKIEDIQNVQGIGPKKFEQLKERITVN